MTGREPKPLSAAPQIVFRQRFADGLGHALSSLGVQLLVDADADQADPNRLVAWWPDFYAHIKSPVTLWQLRRQCQRQGVALVTWNRDAPNYKRVKLSRLMPLRWMRPFHIYWSHLNAEPYRFGDLNATLWNAADLRWFHLNGRELAGFRDPSAYQYTVSFVGGFNPAKFKDHQDRSQWLAAYADRLRAEQIPYRFIDTSDRTMPLAEMRDVIQASMLNLSLGAVCEYGARFHARGLPERPFGVASCGGAYLSDPRQIDGLFDPEREWMTFADLEQAVVWAREARQRLSAIRDSADAMHRRVMAEHTYEHRARQVLADLAQWHQRVGQTAKAQALTQLLQS